MNKFNKLILVLLITVIIAGTTLSAVRYMKIKRAYAEGISESIYQIESILKDSKLNLSNQDREEITKLKDDLNKDVNNAKLYVYKAKCIAYKELIKSYHITLYEIKDCSKQELDTMLDSYHYIRDTL